MPLASIAPKAAATTAEANPKRTIAQQAWLNFVDKVRRGEQVDPTGQYVKDGTIVAADAEPRTRPKLSADRDQYPFRLKADGTVILLPKDAQGGTGSKEAPPQPPIETCPDGNCPPTYYPPTYTSTFMSSVGLGGSGDIVDIKVKNNGYGSLFPDYYRLEANLNEGAGGAAIYYHFTRVGASVQQGREYYTITGYSPSDPIVAYITGTGTWNTKPRPYSYFDIWNPAGSYYYQWVAQDLNAGAGGEYIYSFQTKLYQASQYAAPFHEIGVLLGNSDQIQPPTGWIKAPNDLNEGAGGDYIYFCYKQ